MTVHFAGAVQSITPLSPDAAEAGIGNSIEIGTRFSASFTYDDSVIPNDAQGESCVGCPGQPPFPIWSLYDLSVASHGEIGSLIVDAPGDSVNAVSNLFDNELFLDGAPPSHVDIAVGAGIFSISLKASGASAGSPLHGTSLASVPWDLGSFPSTSALWHLPGFDVTGPVDRLFAVPELPNVCLLALAACGVLVARVGTSRRSLESDQGHPSPADSR